MHWVYAAHKDIGRIHISMNNSISVHEIHSRNNLFYKVSSLILIQRTAFHNLVKHILACYLFHDQVASTPEELWDIFNSDNYIRVCLQPLHNFEFSFCVNKHFFIFTPEYLYCMDFPCYFAFTLSYNRMGTLQDE